jgi:hypothetical protein
VYVVDGDHAPATCMPGKPLDWSNVPLRELVAGDTITLPGGATPVLPRYLSAAGGALQPADPY